MHDFLFVVSNFIRRREGGREGGRESRDVPIITMLNSRMSLTQITAIMGLQQMLIQRPGIIKPLLLTTLTQRREEGREGGRQAGTDKTNK